MNSTDQSRTSSFDRISHSQSQLQSQPPSQPQSRPQSKSQSRPQSKSATFIHSQSPYPATNAGPISHTESTQSLVSSTQRSDLKQHEHSADSFLNGNLDEATAVANGADIYSTITRSIDGMSATSPSATASTTYEHTGHLLPSTSSATGSYPLVFSESALGFAPNTATTENQTNTASSATKTTAMATTIDSSTTFAYVDINASASISAPAMLYSNTTPDVGSIVPFQSDMQLYALQTSSQPSDPRMLPSEELIIDSAYEQMYNQSRGSSYESDFEESTRPPELRRALEDLQTLNERHQILVEQHQDTLQQLQHWKSQHQELMMQWRSEREQSLQQHLRSEAAHRAQLHEVQNQLNEQIRDLQTQLQHQVDAHTSLQNDLRIMIETDTLLPELLQTFSRLFYSHGIFDQSASGIAIKKYLSSSYQLEAEKYANTSATNLDDVESDLQTPPPSGLVAALATALASASSSTQPLSQSNSQSNSQSKLQQQNHTNHNQNQHNKSNDDAQTPRKKAATSTGPSERSVSTCEVQCNMYEPYIQHLHKQIVELRLQVSNKPIGTVPSAATAIATGSIHHATSASASVPTSASLATSAVAHHSVHYSRHTRSEGLVRVPSTSATAATSTAMHPSAPQSPMSMSSSVIPHHQLHSAQTSQAMQNTSFSPVSGGNGDDSPMTASKHDLADLASHYGHEIDSPRSDLFDRDLALALPVPEAIPIHGVSPPTGLVTISYTEVIDTESHWDVHPQAMQEAAKMYQSFLQSLLRVHNGYEIRSEHEAVLVAFHDPSDALRWALDLQIGLLDLNWPQTLLLHPSAAEVLDSNTNIIFRGLRVRTGIHMSEPECHVDASSGRMSYRGSLPHLATHIAKSGDAGQILISKEVYSAIKDCIEEQPRCCIRDLGFRLLTNCNQERIRLSEVVPHSLRRRMFPSYPVTMKAEDTGGHFRLSKAGRSISTLVDALKKSQADIERQSTVVDDELNRIMGHALADWESANASKITAEQFVKAMESLQKAMKEVVQLKSWFHKIQNQIMAQSKEMITVHSRLRVFTWFEEQIEKIKKEQEDYSKAMEDHLKDSLLQRLQFARELKNVYQTFLYVDNQLSSWDTHQGDIPYAKIRSAFAPVIEHRTYLHNFLKSSLSAVDRAHLGVADQHLVSLASKGKDMEHKSKQTLPNIGEKIAGSKPLAAPPQPPSSLRSTLMRSPRGVVVKGANGKQVALPALKMRDLVDALQLEISKTTTRSDAPLKATHSAPATTRY